jgi:hypothetical protein
VRLELVLLAVFEQRLRPRLERHLVARQRRVPDAEARGPEHGLLRVAAAENHAARGIPRRWGSWSLGATAATAAAALRATLAPLAAALTPLALGSALLRGWRTRRRRGRLLSNE